MIFICTPTRDTVHAGFAYDLVNLVKESPEAHFMISQGSLLPNLRTMLIKQAIASHVGHILFIDSDMRFPADTIKRLIKHDVDVVGANCRHRQANKWTIGKSSKGKHGLEKVESIGFGVTLIKTEVFFKVPEPWFATPYDGVKFVSDDIFFCYKAKEQGFKIHVDHDLSLEVKHTGSQDFGI